MTNLGGDFVILEGLQADAYAQPASFSASVIGLLPIAPPRQTCADKPAGV